MIWIMLGIISAILLMVFWRGPNAVWGGLTLGIIIGLVVAIFFALKGNRFDIYIIGKAIILGSIIGFIAELLGKIYDLIKEKRQ